jgi:hypothetical protein
LETKPLAPYDLFWLDDHTPSGWFSVANLRKLVDPALSISFYDHSTYLGSAGLFQLWEGVYEAWLVLLVPPTHHWEFMSALKQSIALGQRLTHAHRLQSYCLADFPAGKVLAKRLGFTLEGTLRHATPTKVDLYVFGKVY